jgi:tRNA A-37 threonylcarbamoyl transferase component Bud32
MEGRHDGHIKEHREYFRNVLLKIKGIMAKEYNIHGVSIRPIGSGGARLSIPIKIEGVDKDGTKVKYFGKIVGGTDLVTFRSIQFFKNVYLQMNDLEPIFKVSESPEEMVRNLHDMAIAIDRLGIPTARPLGCNRIDEDLWFIVSEFLNARPMLHGDELNVVYMDTVFGYLKKMHAHGIFHGDMKPENVMIGDKVYIIDVGHFIESAPSAKKQAYDVASEMACFIEYVPAEEIVRIARKHYSRSELRQVAAFLDLVQKRMDIYLTDENKEKLLRLLT